MFTLLRRLFGIVDAAKTSRESPRTDPAWPRRRNRAASDRYFALLGELQAAKKDRDWRRGAKITHELIDVLPGFVRESKSEFGDVPPNLPVFTDGARALALAGDDSGLERLREVTKQLPELEEWRPVAQETIADRRSIEKIRDALAERPGMLQKDVKDAVGAEDGQRISVLIRQMEESGEIRRIRYKGTYLLGLADAEIPLPEDHPAQSSDSRDDSRRVVYVATTFDQSHERRRPIDPILITLEDLDYIPLPRAPLLWEERDKKSGQGSEADDYFQLPDGTPWQFSKIEKLPMEERPDPAYRKVAPNSAGTFLIDDLGKAERFPGAPAALLYVTRTGEIRAEAPLGWGLYRWHVNPMGNSLMGMDGSGVIHAYDHELRRLFAARLQEVPEVSDLMSRYHFDRASLKNHTRTVALSPDGGTYLFTIVDQAFAVGSDGSPKWGAQLPKQEGWSRVAQVSKYVGTSGQVGRALDVLELQMPISVEDVRENYRRLAKRWHPDVNEGSAEAGERFKDISWAAELMSGLDLQSLAPEVDRAAYQQVQSEETWEAEGMRFSVQVSMHASEKQASDWIYASNFATDGGAYLAGYSGRVVRMDASGRPWRAYDIGAVPRRIADTDDFLYFLTDTRLYILHDRSLVRLIDVFDEGEFVLGQTGFGLLEKKRFRWFTEQGDLVGAVLANNPIRRVHSTPEGLVVETRQRRARITGAPVWWES